MKRYLEQLLEDIELAGQNADMRLASYFKKESSGDYYTVLDENREEGIKLSELIGLEIFVFPKIEHLGDVEVNDLNKAMIHLLEVYGMTPIFNSCVPVRIKYSLIRKAMNSRVYPAEGQVVDLELCDYLPQYCPFAAECPAYVEGRGECCTQKRA